MKFTTTPAPKSTVVLEVELPAERVSRQIDVSLQHLGRRTRVPGFRPGKAPRALLERALGVRRDDPAAANPIYDDAKEHLFEASVMEALEQTDLDILHVPEPEWLSFEEGVGASYRVTLPVVPQVKLGDYAGFPFAPEVEPVDEAKIDQVIEQLRDQHASLVPVEERGAQEGDYAVVRFEGSREGVPFEGGTAERFPLVIGSERMIPGFEANLVGLHEDEEKTFEVTFPEDYPEASLAGQPATFHVQMRELRRKALPDLDDEFARAVGDFADVAALRADIGERLRANALDRARHAFSDRIIEYAVANATIEVPELLIEREVEVMHDELRMRLAEQGIAEEEYLKVTGRDHAALHTEYHEPAEHRVKVLMVLTAIADAEGIEIGAEAVEAEIDRARSRYAQNPKLVAYFESDRGRSYLRSTLRRTQTVETLVDRWLAAHPEAGPLPHLEEAAGPEEPTPTSEAMAAVEEGSPA